MFARTVSPNPDSERLRQLWAQGVIVQAGGLTPTEALPVKTTGLYLAEDRLGVLDLSCEQGYVVTKVDIGFPEVREAMWNRALADGTYDVTRYVGARAVSIQMTLDGDVAPVDKLLNRLRAFIFPRYRPWFCFLPEGGSGVRRLRVRGVDAPASIDRPTYVDVTAQWVSAGGVEDAVNGSSGGGLIESATQDCRTFGPGGAATPGRHYDPPPDPTPSGRSQDEYGPYYTHTTVDVGRQYTPAALSGSVLVENVGNAPADWEATIYGPAEDPILFINGNPMAFKNLTLTLGQSITLNSALRTIVADNGENRYDRWDFTQGIGWPLLDPGSNYVAWQGTNTADQSKVRMCWRSTWA
jgi:hypothetical protein